LHESPLTGKRRTGRTRNKNKTTGKKLEVVLFP
jgi:hypothetical protein